MRKVSALILFLVFIAAAAFAHAGHVHNFLGIVKAVDARHLSITTEQGKEVDFVLNDATTYSRDGQAAHHGDLVRGLRVSVHVADDGKTATAIKLAGK
ncbi:MAG TPA: hypothetical protein VF980_02290 [Thermoanaerobaculia bacterium]